MMNAAINWWGAVRALAALVRRDLAWLTAGLALAAVTLWATLLELFDVAPFGGSDFGGAGFGFEVVLAAGVLFALPLAGEAFALDWRTGTARAVQPLPVPRGAHFVARAGVVLGAACLMALCLAVAETLRVSGASASASKFTITAVPGVASAPIGLALLGLVVTAAASAVLRSSLVATLVGLMALGGAGGALYLARQESVGGALTALSIEGVECIVQGLLTPFGASAAIALVAASGAARGLVARSVLMRATRAALVIAAAAATPLVANPPSWLRSLRAALDDPAARIVEAHASPDGRRVAFRLFHGPRGSHDASTWWTVDARAVDR